MAFMAKDKTQYSCSECGGASPKWLGKCPHCGAWNTLQETRADSPSAHRFQSLAGTQPVATLSEIVVAEVARTPTGQEELDRALGGGIVAGGVVLIGGDPGIGKSTLLLQAADSLSRQLKVLYITGEESGAQVALRARRLGLDGRQVRVLAEIGLEKILFALQSEAPDFCVIDSIQTLYSEALTSAPGSVAQVRECAAQLTRHAKAVGTSLVLVGHVTKDGTLAGPRVLEHIVDTVLQLEGDRYQAYRLLRATKNRFGATSEVGVFEMAGSGMLEVKNPSEAFLAERLVNTAGSAIAVTMEGTRPILVEIQGLTSATTFGNPRRTPNGVDFNRLLLITAVLAKRLGLKLGDQDVFVNVIGGLQVGEPAADLAIALAIASSVLDRPALADCALIGEIGLSGELRAVSQLPQRLREARQLGFRRVIVPRAIRAGDVKLDGLEVIQARSVRDALDAGLRAGERERRPQGGGGQRAAQVDEEAD